MTSDMYVEDAVSAKTQSMSSDYETTYAYDNGMYNADVGFEEQMHINDFETIVFGQAANANTEAVPNAANAAVEALSNLRDYKENFTAEMAASSTELSDTQQQVLGVMQRLVENGLTMNLMIDSFHKSSQKIDEIIKTQ